MTITAFTSIKASSTTAKSIDDVRRQGVVPVIVTEKANRDRLRRELKREDYENSIVVHSFRTPIAAADELGGIVSKRGLRLSNWVNITDDTTAFFLCSCEKIGLDFEFRRAYERCRIKPMTRSILAKAGLCRARFDVHGIDDPHPPHRFLFPFIAKPILGADIKGVARIPARTTGADIYGEFGPI